jgi:hypothetical protein
LVSTNVKTRAIYPPDRQSVCATRGGVVSGRNPTSLTKRGSTGNDGTRAQLAKILTGIAVGAIVLLISS